MKKLSVAIILCFFLGAAYFLQLPKEEKIQTDNATMYPVFHENISERKEVTVPIFMFHHFSNVPSEWIMTPKAFEQDLQILQEARCEPISIQQLVDFVYQGKELPDHPVCLTFDDGYESNYTIAYPLLKKYHMKATIFAIGSYVGCTTYKNTGKPINPHFSYEQAVEMMDSGLIDIQSHSYDMHQYTPFEQIQPSRETMLPLAGESKQQYQRAFCTDFATYQREYSMHTGKKLYALAYPKGAHSAYTEQLAHRLGYAITFTTQKNKVNRVVEKDPTSLYALGRFNVSENTTKEELLQYLRQE